VKEAAFNLLKFDTLFLALDRKFSPLLESDQKQTKIKDSIVQKEYLQILLKEIEKHLALGGELIIAQ